MKAIKTFQTVGNRERSLLLGLKKAEIVQGILDKMPSFGWPKIQAYLGLAEMKRTDRETPYGVNKKTRLWMMNSLTLSKAKRIELMKVNREVLVKLTYHMSDLELNRRYNSRQKTLRDQSAVLEESRAVEIDKKNLRKMLTKKVQPLGTLTKKAQRVRENEVFSHQVKSIAKKIAQEKGRELTKKEVKKVSRKASKLRTLSWVTSLRKHLAYMNTEAV